MGFLKDFFETLGDPHAYIKRDILHCWQSLRLRVSPEDFLVLMASEKGYPVELTAQIVINFEERNVYLPDVAVAPETQAVHELYSSYLYGGDIISEIATALSHILLACRTGAGKSTFLKVLIHKTLQLYPSAEFSIIDPKTTDWLGLQFHPNSVTYISGGDDESQLETVDNVIHKTFAELNNRKQQKQQTILARSKYKEPHPFVLLIDEWFTLFDKCKRNKKVGDRIIGYLNEIVAQGRELKVFLWVVSQSHLCGEIGFSSSMRHSFCPVGLGARDASFEPLWAMANDANLFSGKRDRDAIQQTLEDTIRGCGNSRVILTVMGTPRISILPDLSWIHKASLQLPQGCCTDGSGNNHYPVQRSQEKGFKPNSDSLPTSTTDEIEGYEVLRRAVVALRQLGMSDTRIIEDIFKMKGRKFEKGKQILAALFELE